jgi:hypothetical protein
MNWVSVKDRLPPAQQKVIAFYRNSLGKKRTVMAEYVPPFSVRCCDFYDFDVDYEADFLEGDDEGYVKESWHELIDNWPDYSGCQIVHGEVTHWMPLPAAPDEN